jgi:hypothetical protein
MWPISSTPASRHRPPVAVTVKAMRAPSAGIGAMVPVADQQEGGEAGQLPEHHQLDEIARQHHPQHRAHEGQQEGEEARHRVVRRHVVARVQHHQQTERQDQHGEHPRQTIDPQHERQPLRRQPGELCAQHLAGGHLWKQQTADRQPGQRHADRQPGFAVARVLGHQRREQRAEEWDEE